MELIRGLHNLQARHRGCVVTIGNFDGVHLGHQEIIQRLKQVAAEVGGKTLLMTFEPQPQEYFAKTPQAAPARLTRLREKCLVLQQFGIEYLLCLRFNSGLANLTADDFIKRILQQELAVQHLVIGHDFRFGRGRAGDFALLEQAGQQYGFGVESVEAVIAAKERISSTAIRQALQAGDFEQAADFLGRPYRLSGRVIHGDKLGRKLGVPTANIDLHRVNLPLQGVFVVEVFGLGEAPRAAVANVGNRPVVGGKRNLLEVHLFDFDQEIYGQFLQVEFKQKLRDEENYASLELLREQMFKDIAQAKEYIERNHRHSREGAEGSDT